jgi:glycosyltransferase involved in cell wall biosynthesis
LQLIRKRALAHGQVLNEREIIRDSDLVINNVFKTAFKKNALLSYIVDPFKGSIPNYHSNHGECFTMAEILKELEFNVDVINWNNNSFIPQKSYDLVIDNHNNLERLHQFFGTQTKKVFHATNTFWLFQNSVEYARHNLFYLETGGAFLPPRLLPPGNSALYCDAISMFGNEFTEKTYGKLNAPIYHLSMSVTTKPEILVERNFETARLNFVWLNSLGALLKGLDIIISAFKKMPRHNLYVFGNMQGDEGISNALNHQLNDSPNIKMMGWIDIESAQFNQVVQNCAGVVSTSFSEGGGGSILNCMAKGLIPIISRSSSITLPEDTGFYLEENNEASLEDKINVISNFPVEYLKLISDNAVDFIQLNHTLENFRNKYKEFLIQVIS